jgi:acetylornithine/succinyldiaminopimelate/putrescine aminotransferase
MIETNAPKTGMEAAVYKRLGVELVDGNGCVVHTKDGRELIDFYGGHAVAILGYRHAGLLSALNAQATRLFFQTNLVDLDVRREAAADLTRLAPGDIDRAFFVNSGAEANENALRVAFRVTGRSRVICLEGGWHGRTAAASACTYDAAPWYGFPRTPFDVTRVSATDPKAMEAALDDTVAAVILEPVQGQSGARDLDLDFLRAVRALTRERGALLLADEVQCGLGRTGYNFAIEAAGVVPDLITVAKGLAGGFPAGALLMPQRIAAVLKPGDLGTTFGGGPMACALISVVAKALASPGFLEHVRAMGELLRATCKVGPVQRIQGRGLLTGLVLSRPTKDVIPELLERGIFVGGSGDAHTLRVMPPLIIEEAHVRKLAAVLAEIRA